MSVTIYDKSDKGREEIATRKYQLPSRMRTLLVMVDGKQTVDDLLKKVAGLGLNAQSIQDLADQGFITPPLFAEPAASLTTVDLDISDSMSESIDRDLPATELMDDATRIQALKNFFNETIKITLGLRGFTLQLKVERSATLEEFRELRNPYIEAVLKAKGKEMARSLRDRLDHLLYAGDPKLEKIVPDDD